MFHGYFTAKNTLRAFGKGMKKAFSKFPCCFPVVPIVSPTFPCFFPQLFPWVFPRRRVFGPVLVPAQEAAEAAGGELRERHPEGQGKLWGFREPSPPHGEYGGNMVKIW